MWFTSKRKFLKPETLVENNTKVIKNSNDKKPNVVKVVDIVVNFKFDIGDSHIDTVKLEFEGCAYVDHFGITSIHNGKTMLNCYIHDSLSSGFFSFEKQQFASNKFICSEIIEETEREIILK